MQKAVEQPRWVVHKFGGSSVADAGCFERVARILEKGSTPQAIVVSACVDVTDVLLSLVELAERQDVGFNARLVQLRDRHAQLGDALLAAEHAIVYRRQLDADIDDIQGMLRTITLLRSGGRKLRGLISGYGELWSTRLLTAYLEQRGNLRAAPRWLDARRIITVEWTPLGPAVQWSESKAGLDRELGAYDNNCTAIIPGFIATDRAGIQTTLGRNGSDYSASILGALLDAGEIHIWTNVDGVLSADPRLVPDARVIDSLSYNEAMELAYFGAQVIHPQTMAPAIERGIPIFIRNTFAPENPGTRIGARSETQLLVKGVTSISGVALLSLEGTGMIGVPGTAQRLFGALREENISVIMISQGSSEHSICLAIPGVQAARAEHVVRRAFETEMRRGQIQSLEVDDGLSILAVVGDGMAGVPGIAAKVFGALGAAGVNVHAIAQGASERNVSIVIDGNDTARAVRSVHAGFYLSPHTISIGLIGPGTVGSVLLDQIAGQVERLRRDAQLDLRVRGIMNSSRMLLVDRGIDLKTWRTRFAAQAVPADLEQFTRFVQVDSLPHSVLIDCTANADVARRHATWLGAGMHVVTPNKKANAADLAYYREVHEARRAAGVHYLYEATVGAGLPIIQTVRDLRETGDDIKRIEGIFSGTLAYLFNVFDGTVPFSSVVKDAKQRGYTEPDPRDDLSGTDVARKLIILGREMGLHLELSDVETESLVPAALVNCSQQEFLDRLPEFDEVVLERLRAARAKGHVLRYVGRIDEHGTASVGLIELDAGHAFANIALTDNVVRFATTRYCNNPLIVQGPGAGPEVTAGGIFGDLLRLCAYLGAKL